MKINNQDYHGLSTAEVNQRIMVKSTRSIIKSLNLINRFFK